jgi:cytochrome c oxidase subunit II
MSKSSTVATVAAGGPTQGRRWLWAGVAGAAVLTMATLAAQAAPGQPSAGQLGLQDSATPVMDAIRWFHNSWVNPMIIAITVFVLVLLAYVLLRFNEKANPTPSRVTHNSNTHSRSRT